MKVETLLCILLFAGASIYGAAVPNGKGNEAPEVSRQMTVFVEDPEVQAILDYGAMLNCDYLISTGEDLPVTITWFRGNGPLYSTKVFSCDNFQKFTKTCENQQIHDAQFVGRMWLDSGTPSLIIAPVGYYDNYNYWCQVSLEGDELAENGEIGVDEKSVVMRVRHGSDTPKFHTVSVSDVNIVTNVSDTVTLECTFSGYHASDTFWYKGPVNLANNEYEMVYVRNTGKMPGTGNEQAYNRWVDRATLDDCSLVISNVEENDAGRYWCEIRDDQIGEMASDAKSVVLEVNSFTCSGKKDGLYEDLEDCSSYYQCYGGQTYHQSCAAGTVFNSDPAAVFVCDVPSNVAPPCGTKVN